MSSQGNPLAPSGAVGPSGADPGGGNLLQSGGGASAPGPGDMMAGLEKDHHLAAARYQKLAQARKLLDSVREQMDELAKMGDVVTTEDVVKAAGKLVAEGLTPVAMASLLADMPADGPALAGWVAKHDQEVNQREAQLAPVLKLARHEMGTAALRTIAAHSLIHGAGASPNPGSGAEAGVAPAPDLASNPLMPGEPG